MIKALMEIFEPELRESERIGRIKGAVDVLKSVGYKDKEIESEIMKFYGLTSEEATKYSHA